MDSKFNKNMGKLLIAAELKPATGDDLDRIGRDYNITRKSWLFGLFKESDRDYKLRMFNLLTK